MGWIIYSEHHTPKGISLGETWVFLSPGKFSLDGCDMSESIWNHNDDGFHLEHCVQTGISLGQPWVPSSPDKFSRDGCNMIDQPIYNGLDQREHAWWIDECSSGHVSNIFCVGLLASDWICFFLIRIVFKWQCCQEIVLSPNVHHQLCAHWPDILADWRLPAQQYNPRRQSSSLRCEQVSAHQQSRTSTLTTQKRTLEYVNLVLLRFMLIIMLSIVLLVYFGVKNRRDFRIGIKLQVITSAA